VAIHQKMTAGVCQGPKTVTVKHFNQHLRSKTLKSGIKPYSLNQDYSTIKSDVDGWFSHSIDLATLTLSHQTCFMRGEN